MIPKESIEMISEIVEKFEEQEEGSINSDPHYCLGKISTILELTDVDEEEE